MNMMMWWANSDVFVVSHSSHQWRKFITDVLWFMAALFVHLPPIPGRGVVSLGMSIYKPSKNQTKKAFYGVRLTSELLLKACFFENEYWSFIHPQKLLYQYLFKTNFWLRPWRCSAKTNIPLLRPVRQNIWRKIWIDYRPEVRRARERWQTNASNRAKRRAAVRNRKCMRSSSSTNHISASLRTEVLRATRRTLWQHGRERPAFRNDLVGSQLSVSGGILALNRRGCAGRRIGPFVDSEPLQWAADHCGWKTYSQWRSEGGAGGAGRTGRHLLGAANGRKL